MGKFFILIQPPFLRYWGHLSNINLMEFVVHPLMHTTIAILKNHGKFFRLSTSPNHLDDCWTLESHFKSVSQSKRNYKPHFLVARDSHWISSQSSLWFYGVFGIEEMKNLGKLKMSSLRYPSTTLFNFSTNGAMLDIKQGTL